MSDIALFVSTEEFDPVSAVIRWRTACAWSHTGFIRLSDDWTFSAMADGGVAWREPNPKARVLVLDYEHADLALAQALTKEGEGYDFLGIAGIETGKNLAAANTEFCSQLLFWATEAAGYPLLNMTFIPREHLTPRDVLLSPLVRERLA